MIASTVEFPPLLVQARPAPITTPSALHPIAPSLPSGPTRTLTQAPPSIKRLVHRIPVVLFGPTANETQVVHTPKPSCSSHHTAQSRALSRLCALITRLEPRATDSSLFLSAALAVYWCQSETRA
ncbi:unnamed protein product [Zymoseptoria tritici ST99CH_3D7]|uniref:Uncharacterized protein n=1 Tax=Zymoseptoria tritici (strain ST99CH_3D7) TaxID=1276538 RepID=A0A1X7REU7_ZYMT9|nr:unnamed protein product [Zymoseptoria tritici ST99CH_3D7]